VTVATGTLNGLAGEILPDSYALIQVQGDYVTADEIVWQFYRSPSTGIVELLLDTNPQLAPLSAVSPFIPAGTVVRVPIVNSMVDRSALGQTQYRVWS
jgi:phage tail protein X